MNNSVFFNKKPLKYNNINTYPQCGKEKGYNMKTAEQYWEEALKYLEDQLTPPIITAFINPLVPLRYTEEIFVFTLSIDVEQYREIINKKYSKAITNALTQVFGKSIVFKIVLPHEPDYDNPTPQISDEVKSNVRNENGIIPNNRFDNFIVGPSNIMAHAAALAVADDPGEIYNPLFLYGGVGLGKTHLMHAIGNYVMEQFPQYKVLYVTTEKFTNDYIKALGDTSRGNKIAEFRDKYRKNDVLLIDDIQFLSNKESTQEEFFHTFNDLISSGKQIVICSDRKPSEIETLTDRIVSRLSQGLITDISFPDYETRTAILQKKAESAGLAITDDVLEYVATSVTSNIRELEGVLTRIIAYAKVTNKIIDVDLAREAVKDIISDKKVDITIDYIIEVVADYYNISIDEIKSKRRTKPLTTYRHIAMYLCRKLLDNSLDEVGSKFGGRDHSTVMNGCDKVNDLIERHTPFERDVLIIEKRITG